MSPSDNGGWSEYAKLVLAELERHNNILQKIDEKLDAIGLQQAETQHEVRGLKATSDEHEVCIKDLKKRVYKLEQGELVNHAIKKYRWWILTGVFTVALAIIIPVAEILVKLYT